MQNFEKYSENDRIENYKLNKMINNNNKKERKGDHGHRVLKKNKDLYCEDEQCND